MNKISRDMINIYNSRQNKRLDYMENKDMDIVADYVFEYITLEAIEKSIKYFGKFKVVDSPLSLEEADDKNIFLPEEMISDKGWIYYKGESEYNENWYQLCMIATIIREEMSIDFESFENEKKIEKQKQFERETELQRLYDLSDEEFEKEKGMTKSEWFSLHPEDNPNSIYEELKEMERAFEQFNSNNELSFESDESDNKSKKPIDPRKLN